MAIDAAEFRKTLPPIEASVTSPSLQKRAELVVDARRKSVSFGAGCSKKILGEVLETQFDQIGYRAPAFRTVPQPAGR